ncbi:PadR family transcriptional regulator [Actinoplanes sp. GCM10030250]|uniref:PadR family transcriptional regulator n=1 Tax=Actinoplanes sp. GCM10030250 TaxID=3273376 RepID=UPI0036208C22
MRDVSDEPSTTALLRGTLEYCVLGLLVEREMYSMELVRRVSSELQLTTSEGAMYPLLSRLRRAGRIASDWRESTNGPPRRYYSLTPAGRVALDTFRVQWTSFRSGVDRILGTEQ